MAKQKSNFKVVNYFKGTSRAYYFNSERDAQNKMFDISYGESTTMFEKKGNKFKATKSVKKKIYK